MISTLKSRVPFRCCQIKIFFYVLMKSIEYGSVPDLDIDFQIECVRLVSGGGKASHSAIVAPIVKG
jgi:hypothetical protein